MFADLALAGLLLAGAAAAPAAAPADADTADANGPADDILVQGRRDEAVAATKTATPLIEVPQPITVVTDDVFLAQGAINISDTVRYTAGVNSDSFGRDSRADSFKIRGLDALQFRDGMRDVFSYWATIPSDPYNFSRVEVVRGPASVLFGQGSLGGLVNVVSKTPLLENSADIALVAGSFDRKEVLADLNGVVGGNLGVRLVARARDADTYIAHTPDDRVMLAPSLTWRPGARTEITLLGLYQRDHGGSTTNFLPVIGTFIDNPGNPPLDRYLFVGKPGWDRYDGRLLQGGGSLTQRFGDDVTLSLKARYIDSTLQYNTHYPDSYSNPRDPYTPGGNGRRIGLYAYGLDGRMNVFSTDNNLRVRFNTGAAVEHVLLAGIDYSWNAVKKRQAVGYQEVDLYDLDRDAILTPNPGGARGREAQRQLGIYAQDQIRFWDRVSVVLGARRDRVTTSGTPRRVDTATTFRAGIIGEIGAGVSPFFSYTESFLPIAGTTTAGAPFRPQMGHQFETGVKWQPDHATLVTLTGFRIKDTNRPIPDPANPLGQIQAGEVTSQGVELEATRTLPGDYDLSLSYGFNDVSGGGLTDFTARHIASAWAAKTFTQGSTALRLGAGVRYLGRQVSSNAVWTLVTPGRAMADALVEVTEGRWRATLNATNLFDKRTYASCLARGDCFMTAPRNVMASIGYHF
ncbi:TonB-dependent siderophore receptor [Sphingomonas endophytica]|uniref:Ferrisiderophore receptor n=1 Tax=Sphingomonas endophytica TaxID=869719 RepID=A0A147I4Q2_9SPHN|nr:TonB-dependent siderophore receptor [Sphingomonas endophytica]KTT73473.1 ferrisiderophore receptor [Sphingomonas endophytica]